MIFQYFKSRKLIIRTIFVEYTYQRIPRRRSAFCLMDANLKVKQNNEISMKKIGYERKFDFFFRQFGLRTLPKKMATEKEVNLGSGHLDPN